MTDFGMWASTAGLGLLNLLWAKSLVDLLRGGNAPPEFTLRSAAAAPSLKGTPRLSVIIPARNEVAHIEGCVHAALASRWPGELEVVVVDDRSTDGTSERLAALATADPRVRPVPGSDPPPDWLGKPHALHVAQAHARGDWLLFIDADVRLRPDGAAMLVAAAMGQGAEMASALGQLEVETFWERVVQTRMGALIAGGNPLHEVNDPDHTRALANGQCLLFTRAAYDRLGGHAAIRGSVLDDVDFAKRAKAERVPYRLFYGPGVFSCRMYTGLGEIWSGWTKNLFPALGYSWVATLIVTALVFASSLLPFVLLTRNALAALKGQPFEPLFLGLEASAVALVWLTDAVGHRHHGYRWGLFWTFPLGMAIVIALFWNSAWRISSGRGAVWKGRVVEAGRPRPKPPSA